MKTLIQIQQELSAGQFEFSRHAFRRVVERNISEREIREAGRKRGGHRKLSAGQVFAERIVAGHHRRWTSIAFSSFGGSLGQSTNRS